MIALKVIGWIIVLCFEIYLLFTPPFGWIILALIWIAKILIARNLIEVAKMKQKQENKE